MAEYEEQTIPDLQEELRARGLPVSGNKDELVARLEDDDATEAAGDSDNAEAPPANEPPANEPPAGGDVVRNDDAMGGDEESEGVAPSGVATGDVDAEEDPYIGADPIYRNHANETERPYLSEDDEAAKREKFAQQHDENLLGQSTPTGQHRGVGGESSVKPDPDAV